MNYDFPQKNHWRRWVWNRLAERVPCHPRDAVVLYFAAEQDLDRPIARAKGFFDHNLIAVERDLKVCEKLRQVGRLCVHGDLGDVIKAWPDTLPVSAVIADFTCGIENSVMLAAEAMIGARGMVDDSIIVFNLLRGRDRNNVMVQRGTSSKCPHRGAQIHVIVNSMVIEMVSPCGFNIENPEHWEFLSYLRRESRPQCSSYKSGYQYFDSVVMKKMTKRGPITAQFDIEVARQISAVLAHRTRRMRSLAA